MTQQRNQFGPRYHAPNHAQLASAVRPADSRHRIRVKPSWTIKARYLALVLALLLTAFGVLFVIVGVVK